jgi:hypothetical protein
MTVQYLVAGRVIAESSASAPRSFAYFCSTCGEIWGRVWSQECRLWDVEDVPCVEHVPQGVSDWSRTPGSFLNRQPNSFNTPRTHQIITLEHLPPAVLRRELEVHIRNYERKVAQIDE